MWVQAMMYRDSSGRIVQLADASGDTWKADLTRTYAMVSCACPPAGPPPQQQPPPSLSHRELFRMILQNIRRASCLSVALISELAEFAALDACMTFPGHEGFHIFRIILQRIRCRVVPLMWIAVPERSLAIQSYFACCRCRFTCRGPPY